MVNNPQVPTLNQILLDEQKRTADDYCSLISDKQIQTRLKFEYFEARPKSIPLFWKLLKYKKLSYQICREILGITGNGWIKYGFFATLHKKGYIEFKRERNKTSGQTVWAVYLTAKGKADFKAYVKATNLRER